MEAELLKFFLAHPGEPLDRNRLLVEVWRQARPASVRIPAASARAAAARITGPSARGSENGKPSSTMSAPPATAASASSGVSAPDMR